MTGLWNIMEKCLSCPCIWNTVRGNYGGNIFLDKCLTAKGQQQQVTKSAIKERKAREVTSNSFQEHPGSQSCRKMCRNAVSREDKHTVPASAKEIMLVDMRIPKMSPERTIIVNL